jgi:hypothetical protein
LNSSRSCVLTHLTGIPLPQAHNIRKQITLVSGATSILNREQKWYLCIWIWRQPGTWKWEYEINETSCTLNM